MRIVDRDYHPMPKDHTFEEGEKLLISEDAWCSYNTDSVIIDNGYPMAKELQLNIVWDYDPYLAEETWILR